jgi:hypothetical protein
MPVGRGFPRFFPMARHASWNGGVSGWYVCDANDPDRTHLARPIHEDPCTDRDEAQEIADMLNEEDRTK